MQETRQPLLSLASNPDSPKISSTRHEEGKKIIYFVIHTHTHTHTHYIKWLSYYFLILVTRKRRREEEQDIEEEWIGARRSRMDTTCSATQKSTTTLNYSRVKYKRRPCILSFTINIIYIIFFVFIFV